MVNYTKCVPLPCVAVSDNEDGTMHSETINNHTATHIMLHKLDPQSRYRFYLRGQTMAGKGEVIVKEGATMLDGGMSMSH